MAIPEIEIKFKLFPQILRHNIENKIESGITEAVKNANFKCLKNTSRIKIVMQSPVKREAKS